MSDTLVATVPKNAREEIRVVLGEFNGRQIASARVWFEAEDGSMRPGKAGLGFKIALLPAVVEALQKAEAEARQQGLLS